MNDIKIFENQEFGSVRTVMQDGEPWFVLTDVCKVLEIKNTTDVFKRLDDDERSRFNLGRQGEANITNESGLYAVILRSDKPVAKKFRKWITSEVLPSIRKTGAYSKECIQLTEAHNKALDYILKSTSDKLPYVVSILADAGFNIPAESQNELYENEFIKSLDVVGRFTNDVYNDYLDLYKGEKLSKTLFSRKVNALHGTITRTKKDGMITKRIYDIK